MSTHRDAARRVLPNVSVHPEVLGRTYLEWGKLALPSIGMLYATVYLFDGPLQGYGFALTIGVVICSLVLVLGTPAHLSTGEFLAQRCSHAIRQPVMLHDRTPDSTRLDQPTNQSILARIARLPLVSALPVIDREVAAGGQRAQDIVSVRRAYRGEYAIELTDGSMVGAIRVTPANMSTADRATWQKQVARLASIITSAVDYDAQQAEMMRAVDYRDRLDVYRDRVSTLRQRALELEDAIGMDQEGTAVARPPVSESPDRCGAPTQGGTPCRLPATSCPHHDDTERPTPEADDQLGEHSGVPDQTAELPSRPETDTSETLFVTETLADIAEERAAIVNLYNETTLVREHYVVVRVDPREVAQTTVSDRGGFEQVPVLGSWLAERRVEKQLSSAAHTELMLDLVRQRINALCTKLATLEDISAVPLSSVSYAQVIADYYRTANVYAYADFNALVREAPVPGDLTDPEYDLQAATTRDTRSATARQRWTDPTVSADGGTTRTATRSASPLGGLLDRTPIPILEDEERDRRFQSLLTPDTVECTDPGHVTIDGEVHAATLWIDEWPDIPSEGMLKELFAYGKPGVDVTIATHLTGLDKESARKEMRNKVNSLKAKWQDAEAKDHITSARKRREYEIAREIDDALAESDHGLFEAGTYVTVKARSVPDLNEAVSAIKSRLAEAPAHARGIRADYNHLAGFQTTAPVAQDHLDRRVKMRGDGLASLFPYASHNLVEPAGIEVGTHEDRHEPTVLDLFGRDTGYNFGIFGNIGSGKTTTLSQLLLRLKLRHPEIDLVVIDPLQEFAGLCRLFDGERIVIGGETAINPLHIEPTPPEKLDEIGHTTPYKDAVRRAVEFVSTYYRLEDRQDLGAKRGVWERAIKTAYHSKGITADPATHGNESPTLADVIDVIREMVRTPSDYVDADLADDADLIGDRKQTAIDILNNDVEPFSAGGKYEHLTKPTEIDLAESGMVYLDLQRYENDTDSGLMMQLLVGQIYEQAKTSGNPTVMAIDESHYMLRQNSELEFLKQAVRHSRHYDLSLGFSTQSISEFFAETAEGETRLTDSAEVIINNLSVQFLHYLKEMNEEWAAELGLSQAEMQYVKSAEPGNEERGYAQALLKVDKRGCFPLKVEMSEDLNPREFAVLRYDQRKHSSDFRAYLEQFDETCGWSWRS